MRGQRFEQSGTTGTKYVLNVFPNRIYSACYLLLFLEVLGCIAKSWAKITKEATTATVFFLSKFNETFAALAHANKVLD